ncbi:MAG: protein TolR [Desulfuromonadales bacterium]|jgi:biopolymer transport protein TolR
MEIGRRDSGNRRTLSQINVTPFVDVMLVLLIIFMVTAPMLETGVDVNLPEVADAPGLKQAKEPLVITVEKNGAIMVGRSRVETTEKLVPVLGQILRERQGKEVFLEADRDVPYGRVVQVMAAAKKAGVEKLGMVSQPPKL